MPDSAVRLNLPFTDAVAWFRERYPEVAVALSREDYIDLVTDSARGAFTSAGVTRLSILQTIRDAVEDAVIEGTSRTAFKKTVADRLGAAGFTGYGDNKSTAARLELIYRNHLQSSYNAGRWQAQMLNAERRPWWLYDAVGEPPLGDGRNRASHLAMDGLVFRYDDPIWDEWYPPNGHDCRCYVRALTASELEARGITPSKGSKIEVKPDDGWARNPGKSVWSPDLGGYHPDLREVGGLDRLKSDKGFSEFLGSLDPGTYAWLFKIMGAT